MGGGRNDGAIVNDLGAVAQVMAQANEALHVISRISRGRLMNFMGWVSFRGKIRLWSREGTILRVLRVGFTKLRRFSWVMVCSDEHKVLLGTPKLYEEAEYLWDNAHKRLEVVGTEITWRIPRVSGEVLFGWCW